MKDRADFARKGIARGRSVVVVQYADGLAVRGREPVAGAAQDLRDLRPARRSPPSVATTSSRTSGSPACGCADMRGYSYDRRDVTGRGLANAYAQTLGTIFSSGGEKPYEVEIFVAEVADTAEDDQIYRLTYDGSVADEHGFAVMGGSAEQVSSYLEAQLPAWARPRRRAPARGRRARATTATSRGP